MSDKPSEESLAEIQLKDTKTVDEDKDASNSDRNNSGDLASEVCQFSQVIDALTQRASQNIRLLSLSCDMFNQLHQDLQAKLQVPLRDDDEAKQEDGDGAGGDGAGDANGDGESKKKTDTDKAALEEMTEGPADLPLTEEVLPEEGEED